MYETNFLTIRLSISTKYIFGQLADKFYFAVNGEKGANANIVFFPCRKNKTKKFNTKKVNLRDLSNHEYNTRGRDNYRSLRLRKAIYEHLTEEAGVELIKKLNKNN